MSSHPQNTQAICSEMQLEPRLKPSPDSEILKKLQISKWFQRPGNQGSDEQRPRLLEEIITCPMLSALSQQKDVNILAFLISRSNYDITKLRPIINPKSVTDSNDRRIYKSIKKRVANLLSKGCDLFLDVVPQGIQTFEEAMQALPGWSCSSAFIFHRDDSCALHAKVLVQRVQMSGTCYAQAAIVLQHYLVTKHIRSPVGMIDFSTYLLSCEADTLQTMILDVNSGNSVRLLKEILTPGTEILCRGLEFATAQNLKQYGPALISNFLVHSDFKQVESLAYSGQPQGGSVSNHSMVLIGVKGTGDERTFLLQNWWKRKQFIEVSVDYFTACLPALYFVTTPQTEIPGNFPSKMANFCESGDCEFSFEGTGNEADSYSDEGSDSDEAAVVTRRQLLGPAAAKFQPAAETQTGTGSAAAAAVAGFERLSEDIVRDADRVGAAARRAASRSPRSRCTGCRRIACLRVSRSVPAPCVPWAGSQHKCSSVSALPRLHCYAVC